MILDSMTFRITSDQNQMHMLDVIIDDLRLEDQPIKLSHFQPALSCWFLIHLPHQVTNKPKDMKTNKFCIIFERISKWNRKSV